MHGANNIKLLPLLGTHIQFIDCTALILATLQSEKHSLSLLIYEVYFNNILPSNSKYLKWMVRFVFFSLNLRTLYLSLYPSRFNLHNLIVQQQKELPSKYTLTLLCALFSFPLLLHLSR